jgi:parallel beta-helix repeat protein
MQYDQAVQNPTPNLPTDRRAMLAGIGGLAAGAFLVGKANAGPLNPPAGPIAPTPGPEPRIAINSTNTPGSSATSSVFRITQPGSYYLTGNIISTTVNRHVIVVAASGVTIDLNGFLIRGLGTAQGDFDCIFAQTGVNRVTVRNGHIELAGRNGINFENVDGGLIEHIHAQSCLDAGINCSSSFATSSRAIVISHCTAVFNSSQGIQAGISSVVTHCSATSNAGFGIFAQVGSSITNCTASSNALDGIFADGGSAVFNCVAYLNSADGIRGNGGTTVSACSAYQNGFDGIQVQGGNVVVDCTARLNGRHGISSLGGALIRGNTCHENGLSGNGLANIHISLDGDNRIEGNHCSKADVGIEVTVTGNVIVGNTCSGNTTNYSIVANNRYGPIVNITASGTAAVNGNSATSTLASTDPHANFAY